MDQLLAGGAPCGTELGRPRLPCWPSASSNLRAPFCARRAAFFSRRRVARARRCLAWIFLRRESVILGMGLHPLFVPAARSTPAPRVPSERVVLVHFDFIEHFEAHDRPNKPGAFPPPFATRTLWRCRDAVYSRSRLPDVYTNLAVLMKRGMKRGGIDIGALCALAVR